MSMSILVIHDVDKGIDVMGLLKEFIRRYMLTSIKSNSINISSVKFESNNQVLNPIRLLFI